MATVQIRTLDASRPNQLYVQYQYQSQPQPCYVSLDLESGDLTANYRGDVGNSVGIREWNGVVRTWSIPPIRTAMANDLLEEIAPIAQRVLDGATVEWVNGDWRGRLDEDAQEASAEIEELCQEMYDHPIIVMDASDYFAGLGNRRAQAEYLCITADTTDEELEKLAADHERAPEVDVVLDVLDYLTELRDELAAERDEALDALDPADLVLCVSPDGWSLHAPGATDEQIAEGDTYALVLLSGKGEGPTAEDRQRALEIYRERVRGA